MVSIGKLIGSKISWYSQAEGWKRLFIRFVPNWFTLGPACQCPWVPPSIKTCQEIHREILLWSKSEKKSGIFFVFMLHVTRKLNHYLEYV